MGSLDADELSHPHVEQRLRDEVIVWLTTVSPEGTPQPTPVWFVWDGESFLIYSERAKPKLRNIASNPNVSVHLQSTPTGSDVAIFEGTAVVAEDAPPADRIPEYVEKYRDRMKRLGFTPETFAAEYSEAIKIRPVRARIW